MKTSAPRSSPSFSRFVVGALLVLVVLVVAGKMVREPSPPVPRKQAFPVKWTISVTRTIRVEPVEGTTSYRVRFLRFPALARQSVLREIRNPSPTDSGLDPAGAWIGWTVESPNLPVEYTLRTDLEVESNDLVSPPYRELDSGAPAEFLGSDTFRQLQDPWIRSLAESIREPDTLATLRAIWRQVLASVNYSGFDPLDRSAAFAARTGTGDCTEFSDLFVALARIHGIAARRVNGWTYSGFPYQRHAWVEAWIPSRGWTAFDPTWGRNGNASFERVPAPRAAIGWNPAGPDLEHQPYESWRWWGSRPVFSHRDTVTAHPMPK